MYTIAKSFHFAAAHRLMHYDGPCRFVHGHNFVVTVTLHTDTETDPRTGFVYDAKLLNAFKDFVEEKYDHAFLTQEGDELWAYLQQQWQKLVFFSSPPSTEHLAKQLYDEFLLYMSLPDTVQLRSVRVQETPTIMAEYSV